MEDDSDVPPLEDMSVILQERVSLQRQYQQKSRVNQESKAESTEYNKKEENNVKSAQVTTPNNRSVETKPNTSSFGGLNKGFLSSSSVTKKKVGGVKSSQSSSTVANAKQAASEAVEDLTHIKAAAAKDTSKQYQFEDVQQAMKGEALLQNKEWVTDDLLSKVQSNELLIKRLSDPRFVEAIGEFQKNPERAKEKYKGNVEVLQFFTEFCGLLGEHFIKLSDQQQDTQKQPSKTSNKMIEEITPAEGRQVAAYGQPEDMEVQRLLTNPSVRDALLDSNVQRLIDLLKTDPASAQRMLSKLDEGTKKHVQTLVSAEDGEPQRRNLLKSFYGIDDNGANGTASATESKPDPFDINSQGFMPEAYMSKLIKEKSLTELMDKESEMERHIKTLDSDMQTLVYENYNKFISATDTVRKMKNDFKKMEDEMDELTSNMAAIMDLSDKISGTLQGRRQQITKLAGVHTLLKKLQFLFELPARLQKCIEMEAYSSAVRYYVKARKVLYQYQHEPSFAAIQHDCQKIIQELIAKLRQQFHQKESSARKLAECVDLLLQLNEPPEELCDEFLSHAKQKLDDNLAELDRQCQLLSDKSPIDSGDVLLRRQRMDILEFVDCGCNGFIGNMCLVIASYNDMFINRHLNYEQLDAIATKKLVQFVHELMKVYFQHMERRVDLETESGDNMMFVRALDRFHRRLQAMNKILPDTDFSRAGTDIVARAARDRSIHYRRALERHFSDSLTDVRQSLATPKSAVNKNDSAGLLHELLQSLHTSVVEQVKSVLVSLQAFVSPDMTFAMKPYFRNQFTMRDVREGVIVTFIRHIVQVCNGFCESGGGEKASYPPGLLLILCRFCLELDKTIIGYMLMLADEQFLFDTRTANTSLTSSADLTTEARTMAQRLLNHYVRLQGGNISQMLRKSVETRDWLNTIEPRSVRAVMKRVIEDVTAIDSQVAQLFEEGVRKERSSDSTKRSHGGSRIPRTTHSITTSAMSASNMMNNIQKLFSEKIEIFSAVDFNKVSVLTGIIKIGLKTFVECVRVRTFGRYGLQQIQVDTHYLQLYLWRFVNDENLVHVLIDEIVGSTIHRCVDPVTMETSVVDLICERG